MRDDIQRLYVVRDNGTLSKIWRYGPQSLHESRSLSGNSLNLKCLLSTFKGNLVKKPDTDASLAVSSTFLFCERNQYNMW